MAFFQFLPYLTCAVVREDGVYTDTGLALLDKYFNNRWVQWLYRSWYNKWLYPRNRFILVPVLLNFSVIERRSQSSNGDICTNSLDFLLFYHGAMTASNDRIEKKYLFSQAVVHLRQPVRFFVRLISSNNRHRIAKPLTIDYHPILPFLSWRDLFLQSLLDMMHVCLPEDGRYRCHECLSQRPWGYNVDLIRVTHPSVISLVYFTPLVPETTQGTSIFIFIDATDMQTCMYFNSFGSLVSCSSQQCKYVPSYWGGYLNPVYISSFFLQFQTMTT